MKNALLLAGVTLLVVSCTYDPEKYREQPEPIILPPPPPERVLRKPPDFTFRDYSRQKQFFIRVYRERNFEEELVTVIDLDKPPPGMKELSEELGERLATLDEHDYAMGVFEETWLKRGMEERLRYHNNLRLRERRRQDTLLDDMIRLSRVALKDLERWKFDIDADLAARKATGAFQDEGEVSFLKKESTW